MHTRQRQRLERLQERPLEPLEPLPSKTPTKPSRKATLGPADDLAIPAGPSGTGASAADLRPIRQRPGKGKAKGGTTTPATQERRERELGVIDMAEDTGDIGAKAEQEHSQGGIVLDETNFNVAVHDGIVTIANPQTGQHRTFKVETIRNEESPLKGKRIVSLLIGPDNGEDYKGFAFATESGVAVWKRFRDTDNGVWEKYASMLSYPALWGRKGVKYLCEARCRRCSRRLTVPESIADGIGPVCREKF
jgi:hypothetical protein